MFAASVSFYTTLRGFLETRRSIPSPEIGEGDPTLSYVLCPKKGFRKVLKPENKGRFLDGDRICRAAKMVD